MRRVLTALLVCALVFACGEEDDDSSFGTPTPTPTAWPAPSDDDVEASATPQVNPVTTQLLTFAPSIFDGEQSSDFAGASVAMVGDFNGDGFGDLAIGAPFNDEIQEDAGKVYLLLGSLTGISSLQLSEAPASFVGEGLDDRAGTSVAGAGDLNGDGYDDLLIGAPRNDYGGQNAGRVYVILGRPAGWYPSMRLTYADYSFYGEEGDLIGDVGTLAGGKDLNGDGLADFAVGAPFNNDSLSTAGKVCVVTGKSSGWSKKNELRATAFQLVGSGAEDWLGYSLAMISDLNGDGLDELLIGTPGQSTLLTQAGALNIFLGRPSLAPLSADAESLIDVSWLGVIEGEQVGASVADVGDLTRDGIPELAVGAWGVPYSVPPKVYLVDGALALNRLGQSPNKNSLLSGLTSIVSDGWQLGRPVAGTGDLQGNGESALLMGAPMADTTLTDAGVVYMMFANETSLWSVINNTLQSDLFYWGEGAQDYAGYALAGQGDVNGDGMMDFAIGALSADMVARHDTGRVYLYYGMPSFDPAPQP